MYRVEYLPEAIDEMLKIENYLNEYSPAAADRFAEAIEERELVVIHHIFHHSQDTFQLMPAR